MGENKINLGDGLESGLSQIWIDEALGVYIMYDKASVIASTMKTMFGAIENMPDESFTALGYKDKEEYYLSITKIDQPGLPTLMSTFIDLLIKSIGSFAKHFFVLKTTIDKLAGLELGELIGTYIPKIIQAIEDIKKMLTDTKNWLFEQILGPIYDINIPIPEIDFDLGTIIPFLPIKLSFPEIDNLKMFSSNTPFNLDITPDKLSSDWLTETLDKAKKEKEALENEFKEKQKALKEISQNKIAVLTNQLNLNPSDTNLKKQLVDEKIKLNVLNKQVGLSKKEYIQKTNALKYKLKTNNNNVEDKLSEITDLGIDIYNNDILNNLQKVGYSFSNDKHIDKLKYIKNLNVKLNDSKILEHFYHIGFNLNDNQYDKKINSLIKYVDIDKVEMFELLVKMGFNINAHIDELEKLFALKISFKNLTLIQNLYIIGFNFNNPEMLNRLQKLSDFIDLSDNMAYVNLINKNVNLNNPYFYNIIKQTKLIGLSWNSDDFLKTEQEILSTVNIADIEYLLNVFKQFKYQGNLVYLYKLLTYENVSSFITLNQPSANTTFKTLPAATIFKTGIITSTYTDELNITHNMDGTYMISGSYLYDYGLYKFNMNKYSKYGIKIDFPTDFSTTSSAKNDKYAYPKGQSTFILPMVNGQIEYEYKLTLLRDFVLNKGWVINGLNVSANPTLTDYQTLVDTAKKDNLNLNVVNNINVNKNEISFDVINGVYGNFNKLGLNIKDNQFADKVKIFTNMFSIKIDESVILDTERQVLLTYYDYKDKKKDITINLKNNKVNPKIYTDKKYKAKIAIENIKNNTLVQQPTKTVIQFDSLNKIGLNFQEPLYNKLLTKLKGLSFDINNFKTSEVVDSLISIGWHFSIDKNFYKLSKLINIGFDFKINKKFTIEKNKPVVVPSNMDTKLNSLNNIGFNFSKDIKMLDKLKELGLNMQRSDFDEAIEYIIGMGINFNDDGWLSKIDKLISLKINFNNDNWKDQVINIKMLGVDFSNEDWNKQYNKLFEYKSMGVDYSDIENRKKLDELNKMGFKFTDVDYQEKLQFLNKVGAVSIPNDVIAKKTELDNQWQIELQYIDSEIIKYQNIRKSTTENLPNIDAKLVELFEKRKNRPKVENYTVKLNTLEKIKSLNTLNVNFKDSKWKDNVQLLINENFNLNSTDWKELVDKYKDLLPVNSVLEYKKGMMDTLIAVVTTPINMLIGLIKKIIDLIAQIVGIPLNPTKIVEWAKEIIEKFQNLIELIIKLPTLEGMMDFLFISEEGLKLVDIFLPGFSEFMTFFNDKIKLMNDSIKKIQKNITSLSKKIATSVKGSETYIKLNEQLTDNLDSMNKLKEKYDILSNIGKWNKNYDVILNSLDEFIGSENNKPNVYKEQLDSNNSQITLYKKAINTLNSRDDIEDKNLKIIDLNNKIKTLENKNKGLKIKSEQTDKDNTKKFDDLKKISQNLPSVMNIVNAAPKLIVNIVVGIFNAVGTMENLPDLWNFKYIE